MKKTLLYSALLLGLCTSAAFAITAAPLPNTAPPMLMDGPGSSSTIAIADAQINAQGTTVDTLTGEVTLVTGGNSVTYNVKTNKFTDAKGQPAILTDDDRRALTEVAKQALSQAVVKAQAGAFGNNSPTILAALVKTLIALTPMDAGTYTEMALSGILGPQAGVTDKPGAVALISGTVKAAISESTFLTPDQKDTQLAAVTQSSNDISTKISNPATDVVPTTTVNTGTPITSPNVDNVSGGSANAPH